MDKDVSQVFITRKMLIEEEGRAYFDEIQRRTGQNLCVFCGRCVIFLREILPPVAGSRHEVCRRRAWGEAVKREIKP